MAPPCEKLRLLIVIEDSFARDLLMAAAEASEMYGCVTCAADAHEALAEIWESVQRQRLPDVVLASADLPDCGGPGFTAELRRHPETRALFVALISDLSSEAERAAAEAGGADCFGSYSTSVPDMAEVLKEIGRRSIAEVRVAIS